MSRSQARKFSERIYTTPEEKEKLRDYAMKNSISMNAIVTHFIAMGVEYDIYDPDWVKKLKAFQKNVNAYDFLERHCKALTWIIEKEKFICVHGRKNKPPQTKDFPGRDLETIREFCKSCTETLMDAEQEDVYRDRIVELERQLDDRQSVRYKLPFCEYGARLSENAKSFSGCRRNPHSPVSVEKFCKARKCIMYKERVIAVGDQTRAGQEDNR